MFDKVLRRVRFETELLVLVMSFSLSLSSFLIADASIWLAAEQHSWALMTFRILEFVFGALWVAFSVKMLREIMRLRRKHFRVVFRDILERMEEEQKKSIATESVRDIMAFYRSYYRKVATVLALAIAVGFSTVLTATFLLFYGYMSIWETVFRWGINSSMLLIASVLYIHVHRKWGRKLLKVENAEKKLSEMLGGPIEA